MTDRKDRLVAQVEAAAPLPGMPTPQELIDSCGEVDAIKRLAEMRMVVLNDVGVIALTEFGQRTMLTMLYVIWAGRRGDCDAAAEVAAQVARLVPYENLPDDARTALDELARELADGITG